MASASAPEHLDSSELGTKEYWNHLYTLELQNHTTNPSDIGTIWFSESSAEERVLSFLSALDECAVLRKVDEEQDESLSGSDGTATSFLDLGTGNGHMLFALREDEWKGYMVGVDYSQEAVDLARRIQESGVEREEGDEELAVRFERYDVFDERTTEELDWFPTEEGGFDVVLDKGTFDAVSLSEERDGKGRRICEGYRERVERLVKRGGRLVVTSCNWTKEELEKWFVREGEGGELSVERAVEYPSFKFGGKEGSGVCTVCFRRRQ